MSFEEPTRWMNADEEQRRAQEAPTTALPGPLNLAGRRGPSPTDDATDVLSLDELFEEPASPAPEEAATWTAMPVVPVRSEPYAAAAGSRSAPAADDAAPAPAHRERPAIGGRMRADAATAWAGAVRRGRSWLGADDNALILMTALVAIVLIVVVAALGA